MKFYFYLFITFVLHWVLGFFAFIPLLYALVALPGTALHELTHYTMALLFLGYPSGFSIFPTFDAAWNMRSLGHVLFVPNWWNAATVSLAPFLLIPLCSFIVLAASKAKKTSHSLLLAYIAACGWAAFWPSSADFAIAFSHPLSWPLAIGLLYLSFIISWRGMRKIHTNSIANTPPV